jgi:hypothetical protein
MSHEPHHAPSKSCSRSPLNLSAARAAQLSLPIIEQVLGTEKAVLVVETCGSNRVVRLRSLEIAGWPSPEFTAPCGGSSSVWSRDPLLSGDLSHGWVALKVFEYSIRSLCFLSQVASHHHHHHHHHQHLNQLNQLNQQSSPSLHLISTHFNSFLLSSIIKHIQKSK